MSPNAREGERHLTDEELFGLALPPAGSPEALPSHLLRCSACGRGLQEWKRAVRDLAQEDADAVSRRSPEEWKSAEQATMAALRRTPGQALRRVIPGAAGLAAVLLIGVLFLRPENPERDEVPATGEIASAEDLAPEDRADDTLLKELATLARGDDALGRWNGLIPDPATEPSATGEEQL